MNGKISDPLPSNITRLQWSDQIETSSSVLFGILLHNSRIPNWKDGVVYDFRFVQSHLYTIIYNERPFLGRLLFFKNEIWGHFVPKRGIYRISQVFYNCIITFTWARHVPWVCTIPFRGTGDLFRQNIRIFQC